MAEQESFERDQLDFEARMAERRVEASRRAETETAEKNAGRQLKKQEEKLCKTSICS